MTTAGRSYSPRASGGFLFTFRLEEHAGQFKPSPDLCSFFGRRFAPLSSRSSEPLPFQNFASTQGKGNEWLARHHCWIVNT
jgi:hypothetical protein